MHPANFLEVSNFSIISWELHILALCAYSFCCRRGGGWERNGLESQGKTVCSSFPSPTHPWTSRNAPLLTIQSSVMKWYSLLASHSACFLEIWMSFLPVSVLFCKNIASKHNTIKKAPLVIWLKTHIKECCGSTQGIGGEERKGVGETGRQTDRRLKHQYIFPIPVKHW